MTVTDYQYKIDGYKELFIDPKTGDLREFNYHGLKVRVALAMYTSDAHQAPKEYGDYWYDKPGRILKRLST